MSPSKTSDKPLAVYVRVSEQGKRDDEELRSPELQERRIREWAEQHDVKVSTEVFTDIDVSGGKMKRDGLDTALAGVREKRYGGVIVARLSRFARSLAGGTRVEKQIRLLNGQLVACDFPVDTTTAAGRQMFRTFLGWYEYELDNLREYSEETRSSKIEAGIYVSGGAPVGYDYSTVGTTKTGKPIRGKLVPNEHAPAVKAAFEARASGGSWPEVAKALEGIPTSRGKTTWSLTAVQAVLANPVYLGTVRNGGVEKVDEETGESYTTPAYETVDAHEAIVDEILWRRANRKGARQSGVRGDGPLLGSGLCKCSTCGESLKKGSTRQGGKLHYFYRCFNPACPKRVTIQAAKLEPFVIHAALTEIGSLNLTRREGDPAEREEAEQALQKAEADLRDVEEAFNADELSPVAYGKALTAAEAAVEACLEALAAIDTSGIERTFFLAGPESEWYDDPETSTLGRFDALPLPYRREILRSVIERVVIAPGKSSVDERARIEFEGGTVWNENEYKERVSEVTA